LVANDVHILGVIAPLLFALAATSAAAVSAPAVSAPATVTVVCRGGAPVLPIVVGPKASAATLRIARDLSDRLGRVCGRAFVVEAGDGSRGLALGTAADFPVLALSGEFDAEEPMRREQYVLRSDAHGLIVVGATDAAVADAAADLLYRVGWRRYFPGPSWEIVPRNPDLKLAVTVKTAPAFASRDIWYGWGMSDGNRAAFAEWERMNRLPGAFDLRTGHAFEDIIARHKKEFDEHPEYLALVSGRRISTKFCLSNPAVRRLIGDDVLAQFARDPAQESASIEPSDGDGWCECPACRALGSPSDRMLALANEVSQRLEKGHPGKYVAFYAYNLHAAPPTVAARERVIVSVATAFLAKNHTPEEYLEGWRRQGIRLLGLREYYGVFQWHRSLPGRMNGANLDYLAKSLPRFHALGVRLVSAEAGEDWGANGLGYYVASRLLWDLSEDSRVDAIREDFLEKSFGSAKAPMSRFYALTDGSHSLKGTEIPAGMISSMYARLAEARGATTDPSVRRRLDDLVLYTRYVELYAAYDSSLSGRQKAFDVLVRHVRRMRGRMMVHLRALENYRPRYEPTMTVPSDDGAGDYSSDEVAEILRRGVLRRTL